MFHADDVSQPQTAPARVLFADAILTESDRRTNHKMHFFNDDSARQGQTD